MRQQPSAPQISLFRLLARQWRPVVRIAPSTFAMPYSLPAGDPPPISRRSFGPKPKPAPVKPDRVAPSWNPWLWVK